jgi:putative ABC transport system substrate-binding protein
MLISSAVFAQPVVKARLGLLVAGTMEQRGDLDRALVEGLRALGYVEGKNLYIERRYGDSMNGMHASHGGMADDQLSVIARELAAMKLDAIVTSCAPTTHAAKQATSSTPIIMAAVSDPVGQGLIASLSRPGRNVTGLSSQADDLLAKRLEIMADVLPAKSLIAVLANSQNPVHPPMWQKLRSSASRYKVVLQLIETDGEAGIATAFSKVVASGAKGLFVLPDDPGLFNVRHEIVALAAQHRIAGFYWASEFVQAGGLLSYGASLREAYVAAADYIDKVLKGANPATLAVAQPTRFELVINRRAARALDLAIPPPVAVRADRIIE